MEWTAPEAHRVDPPETAGERETLDAYLDYHRQTLLWKCSGLTADQLRRRAVGTSNVTLLGLVRHMVDVERNWFRIRFAGEPLGHCYYADDDLNADFDALDSAAAEDVFTGYLAEIEACRAAVSGHPLEETFRHPRTGAVLSLRWLYLHMVEEYARHNGHADLIREAIDGATGE